MMSNHAIDGYMFVRHMVKYGDVLFDLSLVDVVSCLSNRFATWSFTDLICVDFELWACGVGELGSW